MPLWTSFSNSFQTIAVRSHVSIGECMIRPSRYVVPSSFKDVSKLWRTCLRGSASFGTWRRWTYLGVQWRLDSVRQLLAEILAVE